MPTVIPQTELPHYTGTPRRMSTEDYAIWYRWRQIDRNPWIKFHFDVGVGSGKDPGPNVSAADAAMWLQNTQKRIDVLGELADRVVIIELRQRAQPNALGRLLVYKTLYEENPLDARPVELWLVTDTPDPELERIARSYGVKYVLVPARQRG